MADEDLLVAIPANVIAAIDRYLTVDWSKQPTNIGGVNMVAHVGECLVSIVQAARATRAEPVALKPSGYTAARLDESDLHVLGEFLRVATSPSSTTPGKFLLTDDAIAAWRPAFAAMYRKMIATIGDARREEKIAEHARRITELANADEHDSDEMGLEAVALAELVLSPPPKGVPL